MAVEFIKESGSRMLFRKKVEETMEQVKLGPKGTKNEEAQSK